MCNFDWELVSKFIPLITGLIPIGIVWFIYTIWHQQKGKEVLANEAKALFEMLDNISHCLENYHLEIISLDDKNFKPSDFDKNKIVTFRNMTMQFIQRFGFILFNNKNRDTHKLLTEYMNINGFLLEHFICEHYEMKDFNDIYWKYSKQVSIIKEDLYKYATYKKFA